MGNLSRFKTCSSLVDGDHISHTVWWFRNPIPNHLGCKKRPVVKKRNIYHINWWAGFLNHQRYHHQYKTASARTIGGIFVGLKTPRLCNAFWSKLVESPRGEGFCSRGRRGFLAKSQQNLWLKGEQSKERWLLFDGTLNCSEGCLQCFFQDSCSDKVSVQDLKAVLFTFRTLPPVFFSTRPGSNRSLGSIVNEAAMRQMERRCCNPHSWGAWASIQIGTTFDKRL